MLVIDMCMGVSVCTDTRYVQSASFGYKFGYEGDVRIPFGDENVPPQAPSLPELNHQFGQLR